MDPMPVVAGDAHRGHDPPYEVNYGEVVRPVYERVERAERIRDALAAAGHPLVEPAPHGIEPVLAVHEPGLVGFLEQGWAAWRADGGPEVLIPDSFPIPRLGRGGGRDLGGGVGRPGWFCFDTATPIV
ncbi:MAG TPA: histone deacetylase family protein, partial [Actinomycetota bacterium]|nr:histone deacetylase family protein [Actinomycetota bacterium]